MDLDMVLQPGPEEPEIPKSMVPSFEPLIWLDKKSAKPIYSWLFIEYKLRFSLMCM